MTTIDSDNGTGENGDRPTPSSVELGIPVYVIVILLLSTSCVLGIVGHLRILVALMLDKRVRKINYFFDLVIIFISLVLSGVWVPLQISLTHIRGGSNSKPPCMTNAVLYTVISTMTVSFMAMLGVQKVFQLRKISTKIQAYFRLIGAVTSFVISFLVGLVCIGHGGTSWLLYTTCIQMFPEYMDYGVISITLYSMLMAVAICAQSYSLYVKRPPGDGEESARFSKITCGRGCSIGCLNHKESSHNAVDRRLDSLPIPQIDVTSSDGITSSERATSPRLIYVQGSGLKDPAINQSQINQHLSVRRHTIGSVRDDTVEPDYKYIRKYSVDPSALMNQLENPKMHGGNYPFHMDLSPSQTTDQEGNHADSSSTDPPVVSPNNIVMTNESPEIRNIVRQQEQLMEETACYHSVLRYTVYLAVCFLFFMLYPLINILRPTMSANIYLQLSAVMLTMSIVPNIMFPFVMPYIDNSTRLAVQKLNEKLMTMWPLRCRDLRH